MVRDHRSFAFALLILFSALAVACGSPQPPAEQAAKPAEAPVVDMVKHMHDHLGLVTTLQEAVIRGDFAAVAAPATALASHEVIPFPPETETYVPDIKKTAGMALAAASIKEAATATAQLVAACGACHTATKLPIKWPAPVKPTDGSGVTIHMLEHQWAIDLMYQGLAQPSDEAWKNGVAALKASPLAAKDLPKDEDLTKEIVAYEKIVHDLAGKAQKATDIGSKVAVYSEAIAGCAGCHGLHGKVWGPGIAK
jgi:cytochrome c553